MEFHAKVLTRRPSNCGRKLEKCVQKLQVTRLALQPKVFNSDTNPSICTYYRHISNSLWSFLQKYGTKDLQIAATSLKNVYDNYKLLDWLCSQKYSTQILILRYVHTKDIYLTVCGVSCTNIDQKALKLWPKLEKCVQKLLVSNNLDAYTFTD